MGYQRVNALLNVRRFSATIKWIGGAALLPSGMSARNTVRQGTRRLERPAAARNRLYGSTDPDDGLDRFKKEASMFLGHFGVAFAAKKVAPNPSLGTLFAAAQLPDLLWPVFLAAGVERVVIVPGVTAVTPLRFESYPFSHSLVTMALWGTAFGMAYFLRKRDVRASVVLAALVVSHWFLDLAVHRPDMPLWPGESPLFGLGLWDSRGLTLVAEGLVFGLGVLLYTRATQPRDAIGRWGLLGLVLILILFYGGAFFGPPPPSVPGLVALTILGFVLLFAAGFWVDGHRQGSPTRSS
jgi:hypothetical protein